MQLFLNVQRQRRKSHRGRYQKQGPRLDLWRVPDLLHGRKEVRPGRSRAREQRQGLPPRSKHQRREDEVSRARGQQRPKIRLSPWTRASRTYQAVHTV